MIACLYDVHGNLPALEAVLADVGEGATATSSAATTRCSAAGRPRRSRGCASSSRRSGSAATASAGPPTRRSSPTTRSHGALARSALGDELVAEMADAARDWPRTATC